MASSEPTTKQQQDSSEDSDDSQDNENTNIIDEILSKIQTNVEEGLKLELQHVTLMNEYLSKLLMTLLESVERPDGTKFISKNHTGGERKKAVLEVINYLLVNSGLPPCPGSLGDMLYDDLCVPHVYKF